MSCHLDSAIVAVMDPEPLPASHAFCTHPRIRITTHIASVTHSDTAVDAVLANLARHRAGQPMISRVDHALGF
nr:hypothetical protein [Burkholderia gladioli]